MPISQQPLWPSKNSYIFGILRISVIFYACSQKLTIAIFPYIPMEQHALKIVNNCLSTNNYSSLETSGCKSSNLYLNVVNCFNTSVN